MVSDNSKMQDENEKVDLNEAENVSTDENKKDATEDTQIKEVEVFDDVDENKVLAPIKNKKKKTILITFFIVIFSIVIFLCSIACINKFNTNVYKNVYVLGINMSGKNKDEVHQIIKSLASSYDLQDEEKNSENGENKNTSKTNNLKLNIYQENENIYNILSDDISFDIDVEATTKAVMLFGRNSNIFKTNLDILKAFLGRKDIEVVCAHNDEKLEEICKNVELTLKDRFVDDKYSVDLQNNKIIITRGVTGKTINIGTEKEKILQCFNNMLKQDLKEYNFKLEIIEKKPNKIDVDNVYKEVKKEPKDAYIDKSTNPIKLVKEEYGYDFDLQKLKNELNKPENLEEGKVIEYGITAIKPKVKLADITYTLYKDKLAGYTTYFDPGQWARANNLAIALKYLNGKVIMPGETFSYNDAIGDTTVAKGYMAAATFKGGKVVQELGGGICQTTSTLYNVALMANLEIVERHQHGLPVGYVPPSRDATVYSPGLDFKFKNTRNYPVKIVTTYSSGGSLNISLFGTKEEEEYEVILSHKYISTIPFTTKYEYDENMPEGTQQIISNGVNGYTSESYITKKLNGVVTYSGILSKDKYNAQQQIVKVGTKKQENLVNEEVNKEENLEQ